MDKHLDEQFTTVGSARLCFKVKKFNLNYRYIFKMLLVNPKLSTGGPPRSHDFQGAVLVDDLCLSASMKCQAESFKCSQLGISWLRKLEYVSGIILLFWCSKGTVEKNIYALVHGG